jgi:hypothetical protein
VTPRQQPLLPSEWDSFEHEPTPPAKRGPEEDFDLQCRQFLLPPFERELVFAKAIGRRWRLDFAFRDYWLAVELEGLVPQRIGGQLVVTGRHGTVAGIIGDMEKYNTAALLGWTVLRFPVKYVRSRDAVEMTMRVLAARGWKQ